MIDPIYRELASLEARSADPRLGMEASLAALQKMLSEKKTSYDEFILATAQ